MKSHVISVLFCLVIYCAANENEKFQEIKPHFKASVNDLDEDTSGPKDVDFEFEKVLRLLAKKLRSPSNESRVPPPMTDITPFRKFFEIPTGHVGILGGTVEMPVIPYQTGESAFRCGADLIHIFCEQEACLQINSFCQNLTVLPLLDDAEYGFDSITSKLGYLHAVIVGPGLGEKPVLNKMVIDVLNEMKSSHALRRIPLIFTRDGISLLADIKGFPEDYTGNIFVIPSPAEMANFTKLAKSYINETVDIKDNKGLQRLAKAINSKTVIIIMDDKYDKIITINKIFYCTIPIGRRRVWGQVDILAGALSLFYFWADYNKDKLSNPGNIPMKIIASYAASAITRLSGRIVHNEMPFYMVITPDWLDRLPKANEIFFKTDTTWWW